jgi:hypothetical protein
MKKRAEKGICSSSDASVVLAVKLNYSDLCARMTVLSAPLRGVPSRSYSLALSVPVNFSAGSRCDGLLDCAADPLGALDSWHWIARVSGLGDPVAWLMPTYRTR